MYPYYRIYVLLQYLVFMYYIFLGIEDIRTDKNIEFIGGDDGVPETNRKII